METYVLALILIITLLIVVWLVVELKKETENREEVEGLYVVDHAFRSIHTNSIERLNNQLLVKGHEILQLKQQNEAMKISLSKQKDNFLSLLNCKDAFVGFSTMYYDFEGNHTQDQMTDRANLYKYEYLLSIYPELSDFVDDRNPFYEEKFKDRYANKELTIDEEQKSLDEYLAYEKSSKLAYGLAYEMYIGFLLRDYGYKVIQYGCEMGVHDKGRDIIASKIRRDGKELVYIIQCKNWAEWKKIPESYICQLFGTTYEYAQEHKNENIIVRPLFICSCRLNKDAIEFCKSLSVLYRQIKFDEFPRIKCNVSSSGEYIYHLPFDRQYNEVKIKNKGEMYAYTVKEARDAGFRRAYKKLS